MMKTQASLFDETAGGNETLASILESTFENRMAQPSMRAARNIRRPEAAIGLIRSSPVGSLVVCVSGRGIAMIRFIRREADLEFAMSTLSRDFDLIADDRAAQGVADELIRFMAGDETALRSSLDLSLVKSPFQRRVLQLLLRVGPGAILTYSSLASWAGAPSAPRAIGGAMHDNPIPVYVPCHRVLRSDLSLGGYGGGLDVKHRLLQVEGFSFTATGMVAEQGAVWANRNTQIFCRSGCRALARSSRTNALLFRDAAAAGQAGMSACRICLPR